MLDALIIVVVIAVFALAVFAWLGWITMCGYLGGKVVRMLVRLGQSDEYATDIPTEQELEVVQIVINLDHDATHILTEQELEDEADSLRLELLLRETDEVLRQHRRVMVGGAAY